MDDPQPPVPAQPVPEKKGMPAIAWVGIGCGTITILAIIVIALLVGWCKRSVSGYLEDWEKHPDRKAAEMIVALNPDLEMVSVNDESGDMSIRDTSTGTVTTWSFKDIREGRLRVTDSEGNVAELGGDLSELPDWVPLHEPHQDAHLAYQQKSPSQEAGTLIFSTPSSIEEILETYRSQEKGGGFSSSSFTRIGDLSTLTLKAPGNRTLHVQVSPDGDRRRVTLVYSSKP